jgi:hypothetical protein
MAGALLRSGNLREFHPLGAVGSPVFRAASQLRAAMRRHIGTDIADLFAVPKQHERGDVIDWYAPEAGDVVPWSAATPEQRAAAKATLLAARTRLAAESDTLSQSEEGAERQVFGRLLALVTQIPSDEHIYLVGGRPVVTFWGFHPLTAPPGLDVIGGLDPAARREVAPPLAAPESVRPVAPIADVEVGSRRPWWWWLLLLLPLLLLLLLLPFLLKTCGVEVPPWLPIPIGERTPIAPLTPFATGPLVPVEPGRPGAPGVPAAGVRPSGEGPEPTAGGSPAAGVPIEATHPSAAPGQPSPPAQPDLRAATAPVPPGAKTPPLPGASPPPRDNEQPLQPGNTPNAAGQPTPGEPLKIPDDAVKKNSTDFLNGQWRSITGLQDRNGNPVELHYDFTNGQGTVTLRRSVGGQEHTCAGAVGSTMQNGRLVIDQRGVRCPDGTTFQDSNVQCTVGEGGKAVCNGSNSDGTKYDVDIVK